MGADYITAATAVVGGNETAVMFAVDAEGVFTLSEGPGLGALGLEPGEMVGRSALEAYAEEPSVVKNLRRALSGETFGSVVEVAGTVFECRYHPLRNDEGGVVGAVGVSVAASSERSCSPNEPYRGGEGWFARFVESSPDLVIVAGPDGVMRYVNPAVERLFGYKPEEFVRLASDLTELVEKIVHPGDWDSAMRELAEVARGPMGPRPPVVALRARHKDGSWRYFEGHVNNLVDDPKVGGLVFVGRDVSKRVRIQEEAKRLNARLEKMVEERTASLKATVDQLEERERMLEESEERFRLVARATKETIWDVDLVADRQTWGGAVERMFGYPSGQITNRAWWEGRVHPDDKARVLSKIDSVLQKEGTDTWTDEYRFLRADGSYAVIIDRGYVVRATSTGEPVRMLGSMADMTQRRRAEERLRESEERFRFSFEGAAVGMAHVTLDGRWIRANEKLSEIVGYEREELLSLTFRDITHPDDLDADLGHIGRMLRGQIVEYSIEKRYVHKDGSRVWVELTVSLVRTTSGEPDFFVTVVEDVTRRKLAELMREPLTSREMEVLRQIVGGKTNPEIARYVTQSLGTVKLCVRRVIAKLGVEDRKCAASRAVEIGLIPPARC